MESPNGDPGLILGGVYVMAKAETGSGKTAAFALPILQLCAKPTSDDKQTHPPVTTNHDAVTAVEELTSHRVMQLVCVTLSCRSKTETR
jgi:superfamily II DNA/RNA helicase